MPEATMPDVSISDPRSTGRRRLGRIAARIAVVAAAVLAPSTVVVSPAWAGTITAWPDERCKASTQYKMQWVTQSLQVESELVQFLSVHVAPGTTGERAETLNRMTVVSTEFTASMETSPSFNLFGQKLSMKVGFAVKTTKATTDSESTVSRWTFQTPGYYGLYKGTRSVSGTATWFQCVNLGPSWAWVPAPPMVRIHPFATFSSMEVGTITCAQPAPADSVRAKARRQLGC